MVVWGENDAFLSWKDQQDQVIRDLKIKHQNIHILKCNHFLQEEAPKEIAQLINHFISSQEVI